MFRLLVVAMLLIGCSKIDNRPSQKGMQWFPQTCLKCGSTFDVCPVDPAKAVPRTVEWCFNDGAYCETGLELLQPHLIGEESSDSNNRFIDHCKTCDGCKCAAFEPEDWRRLINGEH